MNENFNLENNNMYYKIPHVNKYNKKQFSLIMTFVNGVLDYFENKKFSNNNKIIFMDSTNEQYINSFIDQSLTSSFKYYKYY